MNKLIITIDGPSGSGKTTLGRAISKKLDVTFFSSGSIYRVITKHFLDIALPRVVLPLPEGPSIVMIILFINIDFN